jgi:hypothetical protein
MNMDNFPSSWRLEMSIRVVPIDGEADSAENMIDMLHCFAPHPLKIAAVPDGYIGGEDGFLAANGDMVDPVLSGTGIDFGEELARSFFDDWDHMSVPGADGNRCLR